MVMQRRIPYVSRQPAYCDDSARACAACGGDYRFVRVAAVAVTKKGGRRSARHRFAPRGMRGMTSWRHVYASSEGPHRVTYVEPYLTRANEEGNLCLRRKGSVMMTVMPWP